MLLRPCARVGCPRLVRRGRCFACEKKHRRELGARRGTAHERLYTARWRKAAKAFLETHPLCMCEECSTPGALVQAAVVVDHIIPHRGDNRLFWNKTNWQALAKACPDRKTVLYDGGFGRAVQTEAVAG